MRKERTLHAPLHCATPASPRATAVASRSATAPEQYTPREQTTADTAVPRRTGVQRALALLLLLTPPANADEIVPGVAYREYSRPGPVRIFVLEVDRDRPELDLTLGWPDNHRGYTRRATTRAIAARADRAADTTVVAAINASFFGPVPVVIGLTIAEGEPLQPPAGVYDTAVIHDDRSATIVEDVQPQPGAVTLGDGPPLVVHTYNQLPQADQIVAYSSSWGALVVDDAVTQVAAIVLNDMHGTIELGNEWQATVTTVHTGDAARTGRVPREGLALLATGKFADVVRQRLSAGDTLRGCIGDAKPALRDVDIALTGLGWLVHDGKPNTDNWPQYAFHNQRHPRTVLGWNKQHWLLVAIDGRSDKSVGMDFAEMATFMIGELHAEEALNLDGGGSTTMVVRGRVCNTPSDGRERAVGNALLVTARSR